MVYLENAESLPEISFIGMSVVNAFRQKSMQKCDRIGHKYSDCPMPRKFLGTCRVCGEEGHPAKECTKDKLAYTICRHCGGLGHKRMDCDKTTCHMPTART